MQDENTSDYDDQEVTFESNQPATIAEEGNKPLVQNSANNQNRDGRNNGNNRPFARRRRRFQGQKNNGQRPPPKNNP
jgi:hypothetical protein